MPLFPGDAHLQPLLLPEADSSLLPAKRSSSSSSSSLLPAKRSYSMEHFRWGKPVGRKRRPIKVFTSSSSSSSPDDSSEAFPGEMRRELGEEELEEVMNRWSSSPSLLLPAGKRYGGFMKSWREEERGGDRRGGEERGGDRRSQRPLLSLFRNLINKEQQPDS